VAMLRGHLTDRQQTLNEDINNQSTSFIYWK
jgi:hypothetical protein